MTATSSYFQIAHSGCDGTKVKEMTLTYLKCLKVF